MPGMGFAEEIESFIVCIGSYEYIEWDFTEESRSRKYLKKNADERKEEDKKKK